MTSDSSAKLHQLTHAWELQMTFSWIADRLRRWAHRSIRRQLSKCNRCVLSILMLEGRSVPSVAPLAPPADFPAIPVHRADQTTLDGLIRLTSWSQNSAQVTIADDRADAPPESGAPLSVAAFMGVFLGSAAVFEYDLEADARASHVFHGVKV